MNFTDTRSGVTNDLTFSEVIVKGIASSGGLFVPVEIPRISRDRLRSLAELPYWQRAATVYRLFDIDMDDQTIDTVMQQAYGSQWSSKQIAPITTLDKHLHILELTHGPTSAFKDIALQCMPRFLSVAIENLRAKGKLEHDLLILVATSGDTGKAALDGFGNRAHTDIVVFYPEDGVSDLQKTQMATSGGDNVMVYAVRGNFDDCQSAVKHTFGNEEFTEWLRTNKSLRFSSANSINWGRLMPQIVYYLSACADLMAHGQLDEDQVLDISVPTGNFGNILGAWYAKQMGAPIGRLICASNINNVLSDFLQTGTYDISNRPFFTTPSPSMDILVSSNLERLLYHLAGAQQTTRWMEELKTTGTFSVDDHTRKTLQTEFVGDWANDNASLEMVARCWQTHHYLIDPHSAIALEVALRTTHPNPTLVVATAHWAKFAPNVLRALLGVGAGQPLPAPYADHSDFETLDDVALLAPGCAPVPEPIERLRNTPIRFTHVIDATPQAIENAVRDWLDSV